MRNQVYVSCGERAERKRKERVMSYMEMVKQNQKENGFGPEGCCSFVVEVVDDLVFSVFCGGGVVDNEEDDESLFFFYNLWVYTYINIKKIHHFHTHLLHTKDTLKPHFHLHFHSYIHLHFHFHFHQNLFQRTKRPLRSIFKSFSQKRYGILFISKGNQL